MSLRSNSVGFLQLAFLSVCAILPGSIYLVVSRNAIAYAGAAAPLAFLLGALLVFTNVNSIYQFSGRVSSARGFYKFVEAAWGRRVAGVGLSLRLHEFAFSLSSSYPLSDSPRLG
jgi:amino acid transporter